MFIIEKFDIIMDRRARNNNEHGYYDWTFNSRMYLNKKKEIDNSMNIDFSRIWKIIYVIDIVSHPNGNH